MKIHGSLLLLAIVVAGCQTQLTDSPGSDGGSVRIDGAVDLAAANTGVACGTQTCGANQVCIHPQCADCVDPTDGGTCPAGFTHDYCPTGGPSCVGPYHDVYMLSCVDIPAGCTSALPCDCFASMGPCNCSSGESHVVECLCY